MSMGNGQPPPPVQVQPAPLPMQWVVGTAVGQRGEKMVVLQLLTPQGTTVLFLPPEAAISFGEQMTTEGRQASSGLVVPEMQVPTDLTELRGRKRPPQ